MKQKIALVTGGSRGIGKATCYRLAKEGYKVIVHYNKSKEAAEKIANDINGIAIQCDLSFMAAIEEFGNKIINNFGEIHCLVHNGGIAEQDYLSGITEDIFNRHIAINLKAPIFLTKKLCKIIKTGSIVFISSGCATYPTPDALSYAMSKAGIEIFAKSIFQELAPNIRVNIIAAGATQTDMYDKNYTDDDKKWVTDNNPMGRPRKPEEIANTVAFLVSDEANGITGQRIRVNGGSHI